MRPAPAVDPHYQDTSKSSCLVMQIDFRDALSLETALTRSGPLAALCEPMLFPSLSDLKPTQEIMLGRNYPVAKRAQSEDQEIAYLVTYSGQARDELSWHTGYLGRHRVLLTKLVGIKQLEVFTPAIAVSGLPIPFVRSLQRNRTIFDSADAMKEAMLSEVRTELRSDFETFPPYEGEARHEPFSLVRIV
ncbi:hypothetical protein [Bradyrhizobium manausense]